MKMVARITCIAMLVAVVNAATWIGKQPMKPKELAHKQGCYIKEIDDVIPYGEQLAIVGQCYRIECSKHMIYYSSCSAVGTDDPKCYVTDFDDSRPYPDCCPDVKCELDNSLI